MDDHVTEVLAQALRLLTRTEEMPPRRVPESPWESRPVRVRGRLQQAIVDLPGMTDPRGMRAAEISSAIAYSGSNTYRLLGALARAGVTELVPGPGPQRWRLTAGQRTVPVTFMRLVATVRPGEWTSCADVSIAACGDVFAAWMVCRAAEGLAEFPHPHRVLLEGGSPHPPAHEHQRRSAAVIRDLLAREGLRFSSSGSAPRARRVSWDQLRERARREPGASGIARTELLSAPDFSR